MQSIESKLDSLLDIYRQVLQKGSSSMLGLSALPLFELDQTSDYQSSIHSKDLSSSSQLTANGVSRSGSSNLHRGLHLALAPSELNLGTGYTPSASSFSPSPLLNNQPSSPDCFYPASPPPILTPNNLSRSHQRFPELTRPVPTVHSTSTTLQLPSMVPAPGCRPAGLIPETLQESRAENSCLLSTQTEVKLDGEADNMESTVQLRNKPERSSKEEGSWRRHLSLDIDPLGLMSSPATASLQVERGLGKSLSAQNLMLPSAGDCHPSLSARSSGSSNNESSDREPLAEWGDTELFINDKEMDTMEGDHYLLRHQQSTDMTFSSELLRTGASGSYPSQAGPRDSPESNNLTHVCLE